MVQRWSFSCWSLMPGRHCLNAYLTPLGLSPLGSGETLWSIWRGQCLRCPMPEGLSHMCLCLGARRRLSCWGLQKQPGNSSWSFRKAKRKENERGKQSKSCDTALAVKELGKIHEERKKCPPLVYFHFMVFKGSGWLSENVLVWGLTLPASTCHSFAYKPCVTSKLT